MKHNEEIGHKGRLSRQWEVDLNARPCRGTLAIISRIREAGYTAEFIPVEEGVTRYLAGLRHHTWT